MVVMPYMLYRQGKLGPVVVVETPEAEAEVRESYFWERPRVIREYEGEKLSGLSEASSELPAVAILAALGAVVGYIAYRNRGKPAASVATGASGSILGAAAAVLIRSLVR